MPHLYPVVIPGGASVRGQSLGFHAYSLRIDNLSNQWLQEQSTLSWIPPYALGTCIRMYGTAVALILNATPTGQPQLQPIAGEYASGFFSDEYRTEVAGVPVRQFTLVQTVSDLTEGPEPALPPVGVCRIWADPNGVLHHVHSDGTDQIVIDTVTNLGGVLSGHMPAPGLANASVGTPQIQTGAVGPLQLAAGAAANNVGGLGGALAGTLPNPTLATGAVSLASIPNGLISSIIGSYNASNTWGTASVGTWAPTTVSTGCTPTGSGLCFAQVSIVMTHTAPNAQFYSALYIDGTLTYVTGLHTLPAPANSWFTLNYMYPIGSIGSGGHTVQFGINNSTTGTLSVSNALSAILNVIEFRK